MDAFAQLVADTVEVCGQHDYHCNRQLVAAHTSNTCPVTAPCC
jgi:hypothetical protein